MRSNACLTAFSSPRHNPSRNVSTLERPPAATLKPINNHQTKGLTKLVIGQPQSTETTTMLRLLNQIRRQETGQIQRRPQDIISEASGPAAPKPSETSTHP